MSDPPPFTVLAAEFVAEARAVAQLPPAGPPEIAIAGRSNVGKSTLLNRMAGRHGLARVSKTPGRTRGLVLFDLALRWPGHPGGGGATRQDVRLVDLPGYGYAQASHAERRAWQLLVEGYVKRPGPLKLVLVLVDARRGLGDEEHQLVDWLRAMAVPCHLVVTKADKLRASERGVVRDRLRQQGAAAGTSVSLVSGATGEGMPALWSRIVFAIGEKGDGAVGSG
jgi:GTP-binding protein